MMLTHLSLQRVGHRKTPRVLTNEERMRAYRAVAPVQFANAFFHSASQQVSPPVPPDNLTTGSGWRSLLSSEVSK